MKKITNSDYLAIIGMIFNYGRTIKSKPGICLLVYTIYLNLNSLLIISLSIPIILYLCLFEYFKGYIWYAAGFFLQFSHQVE